ncbi:MAG: hypothetical protein Q9227_009030 [Pyrenula ochraceoflavens]
MDLIHSFLALLWLLSIPFSLSHPLSTGKQDIVEFTINLTLENANPTGAGPRKVVLVNGSLPGPPLLLEQGQKVKFRVNNHLPNETAIHFHGVGQKGTPWADGTPGVSQDPIQPGASYLYEWYADEAGTYFYHAHDRGQIMDGLYGAIIIAHDRTAERPFHLISSAPADEKAMFKSERNIKPLMVSDWSQFPFQDFNGVQKSSHIDYTCMDSIIVNGMGSQYCLPRGQLEGLMTPAFRQLLRIVGNPQLSNKGCVPPVPGIQGDFDFHLENLPPTAYDVCTPGSNANLTVSVSKEDKWAAITLINPGGLLSLKVMIDNHLLHVYAVDGHYIIPQTVDQVVINPGDRISIMVKLDQPIGRYTIRFSNNGLGQFLSGYAVLAYEGATGEAPNANPLMDYAGNPIGNATIKIFSDITAAPFPSVQPAATADVTHTFLTKKLGRPYDAYEWSLSGTYRYNRSDEERTPPLLYRNPDTIESSSALIKTKRDQWVDLIIKVAGPYAQPHPMHKHGNKAFIIGSGTGPFPWANVAEAAAALPPGTFNFKNPPYRDTYTTLPGFNTDVWVVFRYKADHPGAWLLHCHVQTHFSGG